MSRVTSLHRYRYPQMKWPNHDAVVHGVTSRQRRDAVRRVSERPNDVSTRMQLTADAAAQCADDSSRRSGVVGQAIELGICLVESRSSWRPCRKPSAPIPLLRRRMQPKASVRTHFFIRKTIVLAVEFHGSSRAGEVARNAQFRDKGVEIDISEAMLAQRLRGGSWTMTSGSLA